MEMQSNALLKEHEVLYNFNDVMIFVSIIVCNCQVRRRDLLILKYDKQRHLSDEIIMRQKQLIEGGSIIFVYLRLAAVHLGMAKPCMVKQNSINDRIL